MKKIKDAVAITGKYKDRNGDEKNRYVNVGSLLERDDGSQCLKLESIPVNFDGWINFYEPKISQAKEEIKSDLGDMAGSNQDDTEIPF